MCGIQYLVILHCSIVTWYIHIKLHVSLFLFLSRLQKNAIQSFFNNNLQQLKEFPNYTDIHTSFEHHPSSGLYVYICVCVDLAVCSVIVCARECVCELNRPQKKPNRKWNHYSNFILQVSERIEQKHAHLDIERKLKPQQSITSRLIVKIWKYAAAAAEELLEELAWSSRVTEDNRETVVW